MAPAVDSYEGMARAGRPGQCAPTADDVRVLKSAYVRTNRTRYAGSNVVAARSLATMPGALSPGVAAAILKPRASKALPKVVKDAMYVPPALMAYHRSPRNAALSGFYVPGALRMVRDANGDLRRLHPGERQSWDDATINFGVCVPWPWGGDRCSDRYGVRVGRFQLLTCVDDASDYCPAFSYVIREQQSYRAEDVVAAQWRAWHQTYMPERCMLEGGSWQSRRAKAFHEAAGVAVEDATGRPHSKLVENWFNRLWSPLSQLPGNVGRYRGEMEIETKHYLAGRQGTEDPRRWFPLLQDALNDIGFAIDKLNHEMVDSRKYGQWVPAKMHDEWMADHVRPTVAKELWIHAAPVVEVRQVRRGMVSLTCPCAFGENFPFHFASDDLWEFDGATVRVYFDPYDAPLEATLVLEREFHGVHEGAVIAPRAPCLEDAPMVKAVVAQMRMEAVISDIGFNSALAMRRQVRTAIQREHRAIGGDGRMVATATEVRGENSSATVERVESDSATVAALGRCDRTGPRVQEPAGKPGRDADQGNGLADRSHSRLPKIRSRMELLEA